MNARKCNQKLRASVKYFNPQMRANVVRPNKQTNKEQVQCTKVSK